VPRGKRQVIKDRVLAARNDSDRALIRLHELRVIFEPDHPEYLPLIDAMAQMQFMFQVSLGDFFLHAWGRRPPEFPKFPQDTLEEDKNAP